MPKQHTLGAIGLTQAETTLIQTIVRLSSDQYVREWDWVLDPNEARVLDALIVSGSAEVDPHMLAKARCRLFIGQPAQTPDVEHDTLARPIRAEKLIEWLASKTLAIRSPGAGTTSGDAPAASGAGTTPTTDAAVSQSPSLAASTSSTGSARSAGTPAPAATAAATTAATAGADASAAPRAAVDVAPVDSALPYVKLRRWPPAALLSGNPARIRMATLLAKRAMDGAILSAFSGQSVATSEQFIRDLMQHGLVETISLPPDVQTAAVRAEPAVAEATPAATADASAHAQFDRHLLDRYRERRAPDQAPRAATVPAPAPARTSASRGFFDGLRRRFGL